MITPLPRYSQFTLLRSTSSTIDCLATRAGTERMCDVNVRNFLSVVCALALSFFTTATAHPDLINVTYSLSGAGGGDPLNPPLIGNATGTLLPLGSVTWSDMVFPDLAAGTGDG